MEVSHLIVVKGPRLNAIGILSFTIPLENPIASRLLFAH